MLQDKEVGLISITGSTRVGRHANEVVAARFGKVICELGGNNAIIVTKNADLKLAIPGILFGAVGTAGQRCTSTRRVIIHEDMYDQVKKTLVKTYKSIKIGTPLDDTNHVGPLIDTGAAKMYEDAIAAAKAIIKTNKPLFGICLGHQVIALANGVSTYKMHNGHRGINHPVLNLGTGKGEITSQNHGFAINREETEANALLEITHVHLNDQTVAGIKMKGKDVFSVQYHPEASPGPHDADYLFDDFFKLIEKNTKELAKV
jgi:anthranilate/para-aminobenzoate synthase component II